MKLRLRPGFFARLGMAVIAMSSLSSAAHAEPLADAYTANPRAPQPRAAILVSDGYWSDSLNDLKRFFQSYGYSYDVIRKETVLRDELTLAKYSFVIVPDGADEFYSLDLGQAGEEKILKYVDSGGGYIGIGAGAYYAMSERQGPVPPNGLHPTNADGIYRHGIGLIDGVAVDLVGLKAPGAEEGKLVAVDLSMKDLGRSYQIQLHYGPAFDGMKGDNVQTVAKYRASLGARPNAAMIAFEYGQGHVFLSGPNPEIEEPGYKTYATDSNAMGYRFGDPETDWPILLRAVRYAAQGTKLGGPGDAPSQGGDRKGEATRSHVLR